MKNKEAKDPKKAIDSASYMSEWAAEIRLARLMESAKPCVVEIHQLGKRKI